MKNLLLKFKESLISVVPIMLIILVLGAVIADFSKEMYLRVVIGGILIIIGMALFTLGADNAMVQMGSQIGSNLTKTKKLWMVAIVCFLIGLLATIAEPDLMVLAVQLSSAIDKYTLIICVAIGVGIFLVLAMLKIIFQWSLRIILLICYGLVFVLAAFAPTEFVPLAFDSGGVTTGPMTVPFIMSLGIGIAATKKGNNMDDSFGMIGLSSIGPVIAVLLLGLFADMSKIDSSGFVTEVDFTGNLAMQFIKFLPEYILEVTIALIPILTFFLIYNAVRLKLSKKYVTRILFGLVYVYIGLIIFLTGVNVGFMPAGKEIGQKIITNGYENWLFPISIIMGFFIVAAEPSVHILNGQVEEISGGAIKKTQMLVTLMIAVGLALGLSMLRVVYNVSIWWFIAPCYGVSLLLAFFSPKQFTAIAFDSGGIASGTMTATFLLPFAIGVAGALGSDILTNAFGLIAMVATFPLLTIQLLGVYVRLKSEAFKKKKIATFDKIADDEIIDFDDGGDSALPVKTDGVKTARPIAKKRSKAMLKFIKRIRAKKKAGAAVPEPDIQKITETAPVKAKAVTEKPASKKSAPKKPAAKKPAAKKPAAKKPAAKKPQTAKPKATSAATPAKKTATAKTAAKKPQTAKPKATSAATPAKKTATAKTAAKKPQTAKPKAASTATPAKKTATAKTAAKKPQTAKPKQQNSGKAGSAKSGGAKKQKTLVKPQTGGAKTKKSPAPKKTQTDKEQKEVKNNKPKEAETNNE